MTILLKIRIYIHHIRIFLLAYYTINNAIITYFKRNNYVSKLIIFCFHSSFHKLIHVFIYHVEYSQKNNVCM